MNREEINTYIKGFIAANYNGSQKEFAEKNDLSATYVTDVLRNRRDPGQKILDAIGVEKVVRYELKRD